MGECDLDVMDTPSRLRLKRKDEDLVRDRSTLFLKITGGMKLSILSGNVYNESRKWEIQIRLMNEGRCDERQKT